MDNNKNQDNKPKYKNGEKYQYNRFEDTFGDAGRYTDETPRRKVFLNKTHWKIILVIAIIITLGSVAMAVLMSLGYI
ncbi:MAG: hypothetical protein IJN94_07315 [Clostridia bacterium]|nr:hypothetical protein [Clostridia bacterium]